MWIFMLLLMVLLLCNSLSYCHMSDEHTQCRGSLLKHGIQTGPQYELKSLFIYNINIKINKLTVFELKKTHTQRMHTQRAYRIAPTRSHTHTKLFSNEFKSYLNTLDLVDVKR